MILFYFPNPVLPQASTLFFLNEKKDEKNYYKITVTCLGTKKPVEENLSAESNKEDDKIDRDRRDDKIDGDDDGEGGDDTVVKKVETVWRLEPCDGGSTANANNAFQAIPDFVMRAVKVYLFIT